MDANQILQVKGALNALNSVGSLNADALLTHVGVAACKPLTTLDGQLLIRLLMSEGWVESYTHPTFKTPYYRITTDGQSALMAM